MIIWFGCYQCVILAPRTNLRVAILAPKCYILDVKHRQIVNFGRGKEYNMSISKENQRVSARVPTHVYDTLAQAADLMGATINQFLVQSAIEKAQTVIENERLIKMTTRSANAFFDIIENPPAPNEKLMDAMRAYKGSFDNAEN